LLAVSPTVSLVQLLARNEMDLGAISVWPAPPLTDNSEKKKVFEDSPGKRECAPFVIL
jgi:hypothetical protein